MARQLTRALAETERNDRLRQSLLRRDFVLGVEKFAQVDQRVSVTADHWDRDHWLLGTPTGTVDLRSGQLREAFPADFMTKVTAVGPTPTAGCPLFKRFISEACGGNEELVAFIQRVAGYVLTGDTREHALFFIVGDGGNGKSVLLNVLRGVLGDYARAAAMDSFVAAYGDRHPADLAALAGARLVVASETEQGRFWDEVRLKQLTGADPITARFMRRDFFTFSPTFKLLFSGNAKPDLRGVSDAMRRRMNIIEFKHRPAAPDLQLESKLKAEWPGILRWMIDGALEWQKAGLKRPACVNAATEAYFHEQDVLSRFLEEDCGIDPGNELMKTPSAKILDASLRNFNPSGFVDPNPPDFAK